MRRVLACSLVVVSTSAFSFDWTLKDSDSVKDLMYFPKANTIFGTTETKGESNEATYDYQGRQYMKVKTTEGILTQKVGYAVLDNLKFGASFSYETKNETKTEYGPASSNNGTTVTTKSPGMVDPDFSVSYLIVKQKENIPMVSGKLVFSPKAGKAKDANGAENKGNSYRGGSYVQGAIDIGKKYSDGQWTLGFYYTGYSKQESRDAKDNTLTTQDAYNSMSIGGGWQWDWEKFSLGLGVIYQFNGETTGNADGTPYTLDSTMATTVIIKPIWNVVKDTVSLYLDMRGFSAQDVDYNEGTGASKVTLNVKDIGGASFALGANYSF